METGEKVKVLSYDKHDNKYYRPAEIAWDKGGDCVQIRFLDEKFCKNGRAKATVTALRKLIIQEGTK